MTIGKMKSGLCAAALIVAASMVGAGTPAEAQASVKVGALTCNVSSGWGVIFGSTKELHCVYQSTGGKFEHYVGHISKFGVDVGYTRGGVIIWAVFAPTSALAPGSLAGGYAGGTAAATVGVGAGVNALIGGFNKSISLQPVSIEGNTGLNVAAGIAEVTLHYSHY